MFVPCEFKHEVNSFPEGEEPSSPSTESARTTITAMENEARFNHESRSDAWTTIVHTTESPSADDAGWEGSDLGSGEGLDLGKQVFM